MGEALATRTARKTMAVAKIATTPLPLPRGWTHSGPLSLS